MDNLDYLKNLGISNQEAAFYKFIVENPKSSAKQASLFLGIKVNIIYRIAKKLLSLNLLSEYSTKPQIIYIASNSTKLNDQFSNLIKSLEAQKQQISQMLDTKLSHLETITNISSTSDSFIENIVKYHPTASIKILSHKTYNLKTIFKSNYKNKSLNALFKKNSAIDFEMAILDNKLIIFQKDSKIFVTENFLLSEFMNMYFSNINID